MTDYDPDEVFPFWQTPEGKAILSTKLDKDDRSAMTTEHRVMKFEVLEMREPENGMPAWGWFRVNNYKATDTYGTRFAQGGCKEYMDAFPNRPTLLFGHGMQGGIDAVLGHRVDWKESPQGLDIKFEFDDFDAVPRAKQAFTQLRSRSLDSFSVGFIREKDQRSDDNEFTLISKYQLPEVSIVIEASNPGTGVLQLSGTRSDQADAIADVMSRLHADQLTVEEANTEMRTILARADDAKMKDCATCGGTGKIHDGNMDCPDCDGTGKVEMRDARVDLYIPRTIWRHLADEIRGGLVEYRGKYTAQQLRELLKKGHAMKNEKGEPSFPIDDEEDLDHAIMAVGLGNKNGDAIRHFIIGRAKEMSLTSKIPPTWADDGSLKSRDAEEDAETRELLADLESRGTYPKVDGSGNRTYNPDEPRDDAGKWSAGGGGGSTSKKDPGNGKTYQHASGSLKGEHPRDTLQKAGFVKVSQVDHDAQGTKSDPGYRPSTVEHFVHPASGAKVDVITTSNGAIHVESPVFRGAVKLGAVSMSGSDETPPFDTKEPVNVDTMKDVAINSIQNPKGFYPGAENDRTFKDEPTLTDVAKEAAKLSSGKYVQTDKGGTIHKSDAAAQMYGVGSKEHDAAIAKFGPGDATDRTPPKPTSFTTENGNKIEPADIADQASRTSDHLDDEINKDSAQRLADEHEDLANQHYQMSEAAKGLGRNKEADAHMDAGDHHMDAADQWEGVAHAQEQDSDEQPDASEMDEMIEEAKTQSATAIGASKGAAPGYRRSIDIDPETREILKELRYSPDQPRDEKGKWTIVDGESVFVPEEDFKHMPVGSPEGVLGLTQ